MTASPPTHETHTKDAAQALSPASDSSLVNVALHLTAMARRKPDVDAVVCPDGRDGDGEARWKRMTFAELDRECDRMAHALVGLGIARGTRTVLMVPPSIEFFTLTFALFKIGAVIVMVDPGMGRRNLGKCLAEAEPEAFIGIPLAHAARVVLGWARPTVRIKVTVGRRLFWGGATVAGLRREPAREYPAVDAERDETAAILFTSGSTGVPKGAVYTHGIFAAQVQYLRRQFEFGDDEVDLATFPLFALFDPALGMTAVIPDMDASRPGQADPAKLVESIRAHGVTQMFGSPALIDRLGRYCESEGIKLPTLRRALSAGAPVRPDILERFAKALNPGVPVFTPYGATEALPVSAIASTEILGETRHETAAGGGNCVGVPIEQVQVSIIRVTEEAIDTWSEDLVVEPGEIGEIVVSGAVVTREYYNRPEQTRLAKIRSGEAGEGDGRGDIRHRMGDLGRFDERGRLWFCGRKSHRVQTANGTLYTIPCEGVFNVHPKVLRTALVGHGPRGNETPIICVELEAADSGADRARVIAELKELGARCPHTRGIETFLFHPGFPVDVRHNAKIVREKLRAWAERQL